MISVSISRDGSLRHESRGTGVRAAGNVRYAEPCLKVMLETTKELRNKSGTEVKKMAGKH